LHLEAISTNIVQKLENSKKNKLEKYKNKNLKGNNLPLRCKR
jgi:hypothetical protein